MDLEVALRANGCRVTRARRVVWDVLETAGEHLSAAAIADRVRTQDPAVNRSSVYRALGLFAAVGIVRESRLEDGASTWEVDHGDGVIHLRCTRCGTVIHRATPLVRRLRRELEQDRGFTPSSIDVRVAGCCDRCAR